MIVIIHLFDLATRYDHQEIMATHTLYDLIDHMSYRAVAHTRVFLYGLFYSQNISRDSTFRQRVLDQTVWSRQELYLESQCYISQALIQG